MQFVETALPGVLLLEPEVHGDGRGFFVETCREAWLRAAGVDAAFVQHNQSRSRRGVLRGLHYQYARPQGKLIRVARGRVWDVAVDLRPGSPGFGRWLGVELDDVGHRQLWIAPGFAHGFCVLSEEADLIYSCTAYRHPPSETGLRWNDPALGIGWPALGTAPILSERDRGWPLLGPKARLPVLPGGG